MCLLYLIALVGYSVFLLLWGWYCHTREVIFAWFWPIFNACLIWILVWLVANKPANLIFSTIEVLLAAAYYIIIWILTGVGGHSRAK